MRLLSIFIVLLMLPLSMAQAIETGFLNRTLTYDGEERLYQVYVPANYSEKENWPVILFLHGANQEGKDGLTQTTVGIGNFIRKYVDRYQAIVVMPQSRKPKGWNASETPLAMEALERTLNEFSTDEKRVYLTGLSNGGYGSWILAYKYSDKFAAALVICGYLSARDIPHDIAPGKEMDPVVPATGEATYDVLAEKIEKMPVWIFHGEEDNVVSATGSRSLYLALQKRNAPAHYTELLGAGHNSWDAAYGSSKVINWMLNQSK